MQSDIPFFSWYWTDSRQGRPVTTTASGLLPNSPRICTPSRMTPMSPLLLLHCFQNLCFSREHKNVNILRLFQPAFILVVEQTWVIYCMKKRKALSSLPTRTIQAPLTGFSHPTFRSEATEQNSCLWLSSPTGGWLNILALLFQVPGTRCYYFKTLNRCSEILSSSRLRVNGTGLTAGNSVRRALTLCTQRWLYDYAWV